MATLVIGTPRAEIHTDDRTLAHLHRVIIAKLRRSEAFTFSWDDPGGARRSVWVSRELPIEFVFDGVERPEINREWLDALEAAASSLSGLSMIPEPSQ